MLLERFKSFITVVIATVTYYHYRIIVIITCNRYYFLIILFSNSFQNRKVLMLVVLKYVREFEWVGACIMWKQTEWFPHVACKRPLFSL